MKPITISLNPIYQCNFSCSFCYLTPEQLNDPKTIPIKVIEQRLIEVKNAGYTIVHVDLYGGEIALLKDDYLQELDALLEKYDDPQVNIITNLSHIKDYFKQDHINLSISFDFDAREKSDIVITNMLQISKPIAILMLASEQVLNMDIEKMISFFNRFQNITSVEIKPYSTNQANSFKIMNTDFENFIKSWIDSPTEKDFEFINKNLIEKAKNKTSNSFSDDHVYITPTGKFAVLEFNENDDEYFLELDTIEEYNDWTVIEKDRVLKNPICAKCEFLGHCLTEHYRNVLDTTDSCNGFINLLKD